MSATGLRELWVSIFSTLTDELLDPDFERGYEGGRHPNWTVTGC